MYFQFDLTKSKLSYQTNFQYFSKQNITLHCPVIYKRQIHGVAGSIVVGLGKTLGEQRGRRRQYQMEIPASKKMPTNIALGNTLVVQESKIVGIKVQQLCIYNFAKLHFATQKIFNWLYQLIKSKNVFFLFDFIICFYSFFCTIYFYILMKQTAQQEYPY